MKETQKFKEKNEVTKFLKKLADDEAFEEFKDSEKLKARGKIAEHIETLKKQKAYLMHELWESSKTQSSAIRISKLIKPTIYVGTELLWLEGKTKSKKKRTVVLGMSRNKDTFHATLVDENNKQTYLCVQTEQPITLEKNFNSFAIDVFEKILEQLIEKDIGVEL